ncbi:MAG: DUF692 domain-containing protein [Pseudomonadales bacterium]|nr:DUF692 domain-containing protein [Pseudomonadales bacterium]
MQYPIKGAGLGLRRALLSDMAKLSDDAVDFLEVAPENWIGVGGRFGRQFRALTERFPLICHGLSLSIGSPAPLDIRLLNDIKKFMREHKAILYSEHLSYCGDHGQLYDLMPIPFTAEAVEFVAARIKQAQDILERRIVLEHVSYYVAPGQEMSEIEFLNAVIETADCGLLVDVNNIFVNSVNFGYDAESFLDALPVHRAAYIHIAGHYVEAEDIRIDTHAADVIEPVWALLDKAYGRFGVLPTLLERDFNFPGMAHLLSEVGRIKIAQAQQLKSGRASSSDARAG